MKKLTLGLVAALFMGAIAFAQDAGPKGQSEAAAVNKAGRRPGKAALGAMHRLQKEVLSQLDLTEAQKKSIADLEAKTKEKLQTLLKEANGDPKAKGRELRELRKEHQESLMRILTPEQQRRYRELMMAKMKELREKRAEKQPKP